MKGEKVIDFRISEFSRYKGLAKKLLKAANYDIES